MPGDKFANKSRLLCLSLAFYEVDSYADAAATAFAFYYSPFIGLHTLQQRDKTGFISKVRLFNDVVFVLSIAPLLSARQTDSN